MADPSGGRKNLTQTVISIGELPQLASRDDSIKKRITTLLKNLSEDWMERKRDWRTGEVISSTHRWHWWILRGRIGGRVDAKTFRRLIDELEAEGKVIEVWEQRHPRRQAAHWVLSPKHFDKHDWIAIAKVIGREDIITRLKIDELVAKRLNSPPKIGKVIRKTYPSPFSTIGSLRKRNAGFSASGIAALLKLASESE